MKSALNNFIAYKMQNQQQQLALLQAAMQSRKEIDALTEETNKLKEKIALKQESLNRLQKLSLSSASLVASVDNTSSETEMSSLKCLTKLKQSTAVIPDEKDKDEDEIKLIVGKYLNQLLAVIVDFSQQNNGNLNLITLLQLEERLNQLFTLAEDRDIIPKVKETESWKSLVAQHKPLVQKIAEINDRAEEGNDE